MLANNKAFDTLSVAYCVVDSGKRLLYTDRNFSILYADGIQWYMLMALFCKLGSTWEKMGCRGLLTYGQDLLPLPGKSLHVMARLRLHFSCFYLEKGSRDQYPPLEIGLSTRCWTLWFLFQNCFAKVIIKYKDLRSSASTHLAFWIFNNFKLIFLLSFFLSNF